jgi:ADP-ribosylglycohydrolase
VLLTHEAKVDTCGMHVEYDKFAGCLLGQCLGDALGYPVEGAPPLECLNYLRLQVEPLWRGETIASPYPFGQYTDDSQMARELLISLEANPDFDPQDYVARLRPLFDKRLVIVPGLACLDAMHRIARGARWQDAGCPPPQAGNGTAMRAAPVGMMYHKRPKELIRIARQQGWITHRDSRCDAGSIAVAGAVALALEDRVDARPFCEQLAAWMTEANREFAEYVSKLHKRVSQQPEAALRWIARAGKPKDHVDSWPGVSPFVITTVLWCLYSFLRTPDDYFASLWTSIAVGGDVDTTAAITGAISGAYNGRTAFPTHLLAKLHDHGAWGIHQLDTLCSRAYQRLVTSRISPGE